MCNHIAMNFKEYQQHAADTALYPNVGQNYMYPALGLAGEAGEISNKVKKIERDFGGKITDEVRDVVKAELGDLLWYVAQLSSELGLDLETVATENLAKLKDRKDRGVLHGNGDTR